jgi:putative inorganic carbon (HCO3(-)) transporter
LFFATLLFFVPLVLYPFTSEVFEFNKMILVYLLTTLIVGVWIIRMILEKKIIFRRTILDIPLLVFGGSQSISTIFSIDPLSSVLGYYSRFSGGLTSVICYSLLYWAFVSNIDSKKAVKLIYVILSSATLVSIYGVLEHFGIDKNVWQQAVQLRVFSTLGQPNWLAAWVVALMPITWAIYNLQFTIYNKFSVPKFLISTVLSSLFFIVLLFTKSRSGLLGFLAADAIFWILSFFKFKKDAIRPFIIHNSLFLILALIIGAQFTPSLWSLLSKSNNRASPTDSAFVATSAKEAASAQAGPALEVGGTESGAIRKIVWKGALLVWLHHPIFGTGLETFAYSFYQNRPVEQNLTSEWDFIYNKAHNEFLNTAANSGAVGLISYLVLIGFSVFSFTKLKTKNSNLITITKNQNPTKEKLLDLGYGSGLLTISFALLAGYVSLLVTNFFGFSVIPTQIELFLFPAFACALAVQSTKNKVHREELPIPQQILITLVLCSMFYVLLACGKYWYADFLYASGKSYNAASKPDVATKYLTRAISLAPNQALYPAELANSYTTLALAFNQQKNASEAAYFSNLAVAESNKAIALSPANVNLKRSQVGLYIMLSIINPNYLTGARDTLVAAINQAPTDAKLYYNLGLTYVRIGQVDQAIDTFKKTIELKTNYKEARLAYAILLINKKQIPEARAQLEYILQNIDPNDSLTLQTLESVK